MTRSAIVPRAPVMVIKGMAAKRIGSRRRRVRLEKRCQRGLSWRERGVDLENLGLNGYALAPSPILVALVSLPLAKAQTAAPLLEPKPAFASGYYETESRNSHFSQSGPKAKVCIASADFDAFRRETIDQYLKSTQFMQACELSESKLLPDGFAFAMVCEQTKVVSVFHFSKDMVSDEMATIIPAAPTASSKILTVVHRIGHCPDKAAGKDL